MQRLIRGVLLALAAILPFAALLGAQTNAGTVYGVVLDPFGSPVSAADITLSGTAAPRKSSSDPKGVFRLLAVPPGRYTLTVAAPAFATFTREDVGVSAGKHTQVDAVLGLAGVTESVTVGGEASKISAGPVETGQTFSADQIAEIPTSRDVWSLVQQVPGVQVDMVDVAGNRSAVVGGPAYLTRGSGNVAYQVDGATTTDNTAGYWDARQNGGTEIYLDFSTLQEVDVVTGGASLEQQTSGVTINTVTKRGTNALKGSGRYLYASAAWQSDNTPQQVSDLGLESNSTRYIREYGGEAGGPLWRDRLWLWAAGGRQDVSLNPATLNPGDVAEADTAVLEPWSAKLNAQISSANSAALYYLHSARNNYGFFYGLDQLPASRLNRLIPTDFYKADDSNVFSANLFASVFVNYENTSLLSTPIGGIDQDVAYYDRLWHYSFYYNDNHIPERQANLQVSRFFTTGSITHELKFDFNYRQQTASSISSAPGSQNLGYQNVPFDLPDGTHTYTDLTRGIDRRFEMEYWTGALGDTLTLDRLTLSLGLRYDLQRAKNQPSVSFANAMFADPCTHCGLNDAGSFPGLPEVRYHGADQWQFQFTNWQPRISATYALGSQKETLLRASFALYADQLGALAPQLNGLPSINGYNYEWVDLNHDHKVQANEVDFTRPAFPPYNWYAGIDPASLPNSPNTVAPGFRTPATDEITAGIDRQVTTDLAVSGTVTYRHTSNLLSTVPNGVNLSDYEFVGFATGVAHGLDGRVLTFDEPYFNLATGASGVEFVNRPGATQRYYGLDLSIVKRLSNRWTVRANFGWNDFRQYLTPQSIQDPNNGGQNDNGAYAIGYANWSFNVSGVYQGPWGLTFGVNFYGRQGNGNPSYVTAHTDNGNDPTLLIGSLTSPRYPDVYQLDLRIQESYEVGSVTIIPAVELFNATNRATIISTDQSVGDYEALSGYAPNPHYGQITEVQSPRIVRLGLQINF